MDSLLANYASSDEEEEEEQQQQHHHHQEESDSPPKPPSKFSGDHSSPKFSEPTRTSSTFFSSLPQPKSSSLFLSLPPPKSHLPTPQTLTNLSPSHPQKQDQVQQHQLEEESNSASKFSGSAKPSLFLSSPPEPKPKSSSVFSFLPPPKSHHSNPQTLTTLSPSNPNPKKVVQFKLPINPFLTKPLDEDEDEDNDVKEKEIKRHREFETASVKSFLSSIPAPRNSATLGAAPSSGLGRRSIVETDVPTSSSDVFKAEEEEEETGIDSNVGNFENNWVSGSSAESVSNGGDASNWAQIDQNYGNHDNYGSHGDFGNYGYYESKWVDKSTPIPPTMAEMSGMGESVVRVPGKRGRNEVPMEVIEVKQDELIKNRPREDQVKLTGIAFGPSYQPVSTKGKPTKLHKRKHQIGSLYFDMKQKEMELSERRSKGFLTKAETQAKYGW